MKTILIEWKSGLRQVHTDTAENLLDLLVMEIDHIEEVEYVEHIDKRNEVKVSQRQTRPHTTTIC